MRIQELLSKEDFGLVLSRTLERYWSSRGAGNVQVRWMPMALASGQRWLGNARLNVFCQSVTDRRNFEVIQREFGAGAGGGASWKRRAYVRAALTPGWFSRFSDVHFDVTPAIEDSADWLVLGGRNRLRLVNAPQERCVTIQKHGRDLSVLTREIAARRRFGGASPPLGAVAEDGTWFEETYVAGTPVNRLDRAKTDGHMSGVGRWLECEVIRPTLRHENARSWLTARLERIERHLGGDLGPRGVRPLGQLLTLVESVFGPSDLIPVSETHGDFHEANVLGAGSRTWLIDWENTEARFSAYDLLVYALGTRRAVWRDPMEVSVSAGPDRFPGTWPGMEEWQHGRRRALTAFFIEDLLFRAEELPRPSAAIVYKLYDTLCSLNLKPQ